MTLDAAALARHELERHHSMLLYADRQQMKRGEFEEVARSLERRARLRHGLYAGLAVYGLVLGLFTGGGATLFLLMAAASATDYSHVKRTAATIRRLAAADQETPAAGA
jgi:hypothetical protein